MTIWSVAENEKLKRPKAPPRVPEIANRRDLARAEITSGVGSSKHLNEKVRKAFGVPYAFLTEEQWKEIQSKSGLRHTARFELNIALRRYWLERFDATISDKTREDVAEATKKLKETYGALAELIVNAEFFKGPLEYHQRSPLQQRLELEDTCETISRAQIILAAAAKRLARGRGQPSYGPLYDLIHHLDFILCKSHGVRVTRSKNRISAGGATDTPMEYVWTVIKAANLEVSKSTVDTILRDYIKDRDEHDRAFADRAI
jgi:hypothetical protein